MESLAKILPMFLILLAGTTLSTQVTAGPAQCSALDQIQKNINSLQAEADKLKQSCYTQGDDPCSKDLIAYYKFDRSFRDVCYGHNAVRVGSVVLTTSSGISDGAAFFNGASKLQVSSLNGYQWDSNFSVSLWFKRTGQQVNYQGIINNGYGSYGSWEIRMGRENSGQKIGGGVVTSNSGKTWDYTTTASYNHWHHVVMTYDGITLRFYLDNKSQNGNSKCCKGSIVSKKNDVVIGQAGHGMSREYFYGYIDEVKLFKKALTADEVTQLYQLKNV